MVEELRMEKGVLEEIALDDSLAQWFVSSGKIGRERWIRKLESFNGDIDGLKREAEGVWKEAYSKYSSSPLILREVLADLKLKIYVNRVREGNMQVASSNDYKKLNSREKQYRPIDVDRNSYISPPLA